MHAEALTSKHSVVQANARKAMTSRLYLQVVYTYNFTVNFYTFVIIMV